MIVLAGRPKSQEWVASRRDGMILDVLEIQKYLPHRYPFLMIDGVLKWSG